MAALFSLFVSKKKIIKLFTGFIDKTIKNENEINSALERLYFDLPEAIFRMGSVRDYNYFISSSQKKEQDALIAGLGTLPRLDSKLAKLRTGLVELTKHFPLTKIERSAVYARFIYYHNPSFQNFCDSCEFNNNEYKLIPRLFSQEPSAFFSCILENSRLVQYGILSSCDHLNTMSGGGGIEKNIVLYLISGGKRDLVSDYCTLDKKNRWLQKILILTPSRS